MTANIPQPADPEAAKAASEMAMKMLCPMHQTMVTAPAMVSYCDHACCTLFTTCHRRCCKSHDNFYTQADHAKQALS